MDVSKTDIQTIVRYLNDAIGLYGNSLKDVNRKRLIKLLIKKLQRKINDKR